MAAKDVIDYYNQVCKDYTEMLQTLTDMEEAFNENLVSEAQLEQIKNIIKPLKENYMTLSWVVFLLNKPSRKEKFKGYDRRMAKFKSDKDENRSMENVLKQNQAVLDEMKNHQFQQE